MTLGRERPLAKTQISFQIREPDQSGHRAGVNAIKWCPIYSKLYTAGRDSIIRKWTVKDTVNESPCFDTMEHHTDWVNDIIVCDKGEFLISASNDQSLKVWNAKKSSCLSTLRTHKDYVSCLAYSPSRNQLFSGGFDNQIYLWEMNSLTTLTVENSTVTCTNLTGAHNSLYSIDVNKSGTVVVAGGTEKQIRLWDPRTEEKIMKLKGHKDNVRSLKVSDDGTSCVSGSSDGTVRLWSIGQQRIVRVFQISEIGIWAIAVDPHFRWVYAAGKNGEVTALSLIEPDCNYSVCRVSSPILALELDYADHSIWTATQNSDICRWDIIPEEKLTPDFFQTKTEEELAKPFNKIPSYKIKGLPTIKQFKVLANRRYILVKYSNEAIAIFDVFTGNKDLQESLNWEDCLKGFETLLYVPSWFSVDLKCGFLQIIMSEEDCFSGIINSRDAGFPPIPCLEKNCRINLGRLMITILLYKWPALQNVMETAQSRPESLASSDNGSRQDDSSSTAEIIKEELENDQLLMNRLIISGICLPQNTIIFIQDLTGSKFVRLGWLQMGLDSYVKQVNEVLPQWVKVAVLKQIPPVTNKIPFLLIPWVHNEKKPLSILKKERLTAGDMLQIQKVSKHVYEKLFLQENEKECNEDYLTEIANSQIEILCGDCPLNPDLDLRTVKHLIWKKFSAVELQYRRRRSND